MKILVASDIHGSALFCQKLVDRFEKERADKLLLLGDILYHGPRNDLPDEYAPKKVIDMLNKIKDKIICVRGNCDTEVDQMVLEFPILADYCLVLLGERTFFATHGHVYNEQKLPPLQKGDVLLNGHTHIPKCTEHDDYIYMNPGSVSIPKENSAHGYMLLSENTAEWKTLDDEVYMSYTYEA